MGRERKVKGGAGGGGGCRAEARDAGKPGRVRGSQLPSVAREPAPEREARETVPQAALCPPSTRTYARIHGLNSCCRVSDSTDIRPSLSR